MVDDPVVAADLVRARKLLDGLRIPHLPWCRWSNSRNVIRSPAISIRGEKRKRRRGGGSRQAGRNEGSGAPRIDLRGAPRVRPVPPSVAATPTAFPTLVADYADGLTQVQIAKKYGLHVQTVRKRLIDAGVDTRARLRVLSVEDVRAARAALDHGASVREIARRLGVAHTTVTQSLARRNEAPESPSRTTGTRSRTAPTRVRPRRPPLRTTPETSPDQGKHEKQTGPNIEMPGPDLGYLRSEFSNFPPKAKTLVMRLNRGVYSESKRPVEPSTVDVRGPVVREVEKAQTFLSSAEVDRLVADYMAGVGVGVLAERYGIHRATVATHLRRRNVLRCRPGLDVNEQAEAVRLYRAGMSLRAIGQRMGVDRKAVRALVVTAGVAIRRGRRLGT